MYFLLDSSNKPISYFSDDQKFTKKEENLNIVKYNAVPDEVRFIMKYCYWDKNQFLLLLTRKPFASVKNKLIDLHKDNYTQKHKGISDTKEEKDIQKELQDAHLSYCDNKDVDMDRVIYCKKVASMIDEPGFDKLFCSMRYGCYDDIVVAFKELPTKSKQMILDSDIWSDDDKNLLLNVWKAF